MRTPHLALVQRCLLLVCTYVRTSKYQLTSTGGGTCDGGDAGDARLTEEESEALSLEAKLDTDGEASLGEEGVEITKGMPRVARPATRDPIIVQLKRIGGGVFGN